ncbi:unnamed protein product [Caenorhabditis angaria]|uniref:Uncharacterized protein n=1 Tax=Caenorhabditis angaria TaxID=860376 RepID=A0A9P1ILX4_9PELO|nr:unnamed protein product [Caenorhabditis angaria]
MRIRHFFDIESFFFSFVHVFLALATFYFHYYNYVQQCRSFFLAKMADDGVRRWILQGINIYWALVLAAVIFSFLLCFFCLTYTVVYDIQPCIIVCFAMCQSFCYSLIWKFHTVHREKAQDLRNARRYASEFEENLEFMIPLTIIFLAFSIFTIAVYILCIYFEMTKPLRDSLASSPLDQDQVAGKFKTS